MSNLPIATGIPELDKDLENLFGQEEKGVLESTARAAGDPSLTFQQLSDKLGEGILRVSVAVANDTTFELVKRECAEVSWPHLQRARQLVLSRFPGFMTHPAILEKAAQGARTLAESQMIETVPGNAKTLPLRLNIVSRVSHVSVFFPLKQEGRDLLLPAVRVGLADKRGEVLLDTTLDWDDALFVAARFLEITVDEMENWKGMADQKRLELPKETELRSKLERIQEAVKKLEPLFAGYGLSPSASAGEPLQKAEAREK